jgi:drug/metabolite transporter (DMT)-like permease
MALSAIGIVMVKPILDRSDPWWVTTVRLIAGAMLVAGMALWRSNRAAVARAFRPGRHWRVAIPSAVTGTYLAMFFWILGVKHTRASVASVLNQLSTLFIVILAIVFLKEKLSLRKGLAVVLAIAGALAAPN